MRYTKAEIEAACNLLNACASHEFATFGTANSGGDFTDRVRDLADLAIRTVHNDFRGPDDNVTTRALEAEYRLRKGWLP